MLHLPFCRWHYPQNISSLFSADLNDGGEAMCWNAVKFSLMFECGAALLGEESGDFTSGLGATGWTGLVCLAASFFRLTRRFSNISWTEICFWKTLSIWSWWRSNPNREFVAFKRGKRRCYLSLLRTDPELSVEHRLVLTADGAAVSQRVQRWRVQVSLQFLQSCFSSILRLTSVNWLAGQEEDALLTPLGYLQGLHLEGVQLPKLTMLMFPIK